MAELPRDCYVLPVCLRLVFLFDNAAISFSGVERLCPRFSWKSYSSGTEIVPNGQQKVGVNFGRGIGSEESKHKISADIYW